MKSNTLKVGASLVAIIAIGGFTFNTMYERHQQNQKIIAQCYEQFEAGYDITLSKQHVAANVSCDTN